jgi:molybdate transport system permease protein
MARSILVRTAPPVSAVPARWSFDAWRLLSLPLLAFLILPLAALFLRASPARLGANLANPQVLQAVAISLQTSLLATGLTVLVGTPVAYLLARRTFPLRRVVDTLIDLPIVLPPAVAGVALLMAFGRRGLLGAPLADLGIAIPFTRAAVVMAQMFVAAPFYVAAATVGLAAVDVELEEAAALNGASGWQVFRRVFLPLAWPALVTGSVMTWARAGRIRRDHHFRRELPGAHADHAAGDLHGLRAGPQSGLDVVADPGWLFVLRVDDRAGCIPACAAGTAIRRGGQRRSRARWILRSATEKG